MRTFVTLFVLCLCAGAETRVLTLKETVELALRQNPDLALVRLDEQRTALNARIAKDPFIPKFVLGSGLAYTSGFPLSIEGSAPSLLQARAISAIYNRPQSYLLAQARELVRGAALDTQAKRDEVALKTAELYLDAQRARRQLDLARRQAESLERVAETVRARVVEGRELPIEEKRATVNLARARQRVRIIEGDVEYTANALASALGFSPEDRVEPADADTAAPELPPSEETLVEEALRSSRELKRLESSLLAKGYELRSYRSSRLPRIDLVAQYALLGRFNNYDLFFNRFQRHNWQLGGSFQLPVLPGAAAGAQAKQAEIDQLRLRTQINQARNRIALDARRAWRDAQEAEAARDVAKMDLELARDQLSVLLAQLAEGRAGQRQIEDARFLENERWIAFYDAVRALEQARLNVLKQSGDLLAALR